MAANGAIKISDNASCAPTPLLCTCKCLELHDMSIEMYGQFAHIGL
jgi:hypothetical protein